MAESILAAALGLKGKIPVIPDLPTINPQQEQGKSIAGNLAALPAANQLAAGVNKFNFDELQKMYAAAIPGYADIMAAGSKQIQSELSGLLPADVQRTIQRSSGAKSFAGGYGGSGMAGGASAESLGIASLDLIQKGLGHADAWLNAAAARLPHLADSTSMFISPSQQIAVDTNERNNQFNVQFARNKLAAMPTPLEQALGGFLDWIATTGESIASAYAGNIGGAMGGGGGGSKMGGKGGAPTSYFTQNAGMTSGNAGDMPGGFGGGVNNTGTNTWDWNF